MADFPATPAVPGNMSETDKAKLDGFFNNPGAVQSFVWFHLLPQPASNGTPSDATTSNSSYEVKARFLFDFGRLNVPNTNLSGRLYARGRVSSGNGDIRLFNVTDAAELGVLNFTETVDTTKQVDLTGIPASGVKLIEVQMRRTGGGVTLTIVSSSADFVLSVP